MEDLREMEPRLSARNSPKKINLALQPRNGSDYMLPYRRLAQRTSEMQLVLTKLPMMALIFIKSPFGIIPAIVGYSLALPAAVELATYFRTGRPRMQLGKDVSVQDVLEYQNAKQLGHNVDIHIEQSVQILEESLGTRHHTVIIQDSPSMQ